MRSSVGHGYAGIQRLKLNSKTSDCKNYSKKVLKMIDAVNVADIIVYHY